MFLNAELFKFNIDMPHRDVIEAILDKSLNSSNDYTEQRSNIYNAC